MVGFFLQCNKVGVVPTVSLFRYCYFVKRSPAHKDWHYFAARTGRRVVDDMPSSVHGWKSEFFYVENVKNRKWPFSVKWREYDSGRNKAPKLSGSEKELAEKLWVKRLNVRVISDRQLRDAGLLGAEKDFSELSSEPFSLLVLLVNHVLT
jgi:hypothetical protein